MYGWDTEFELNPDDPESRRAMPLMSSQQKLLEPEEHFVCKHRDVEPVHWYTRIFLSQLDKVLNWGLVAKNIMLIRWQLKFYFT